MKNIIFVILGMLLLCHACIEDESALPDKPISEITISADFDSLSVDFGMELVYEPQIEQTGDLDLTYEWSYSQIDKKGNRDSLRFLSNERVLRHQFKKLGNYDLRLKVSNEHGSTFKKFALSVRAFDEGIFVLSKDDAGKGRVSFMRPLSREEMEEGKEETFNTDVFNSVNPGYVLNDPVDVEKIGPDIFLLSRGDNSVYRIDAQTFDLYNIIDLKTEISEDRPLAIVSMDRSITTYAVWCEQGNFANVDYNGDIVFQSDLNENGIVLDKMYSMIYKAPIPPSTYVLNMKCYYIFLNYEQSYMYYLYNYPATGDAYYTQERWDFPDEDLINVVMDENMFVYLITRSKQFPERINHRIYQASSKKRNLTRKASYDYSYSAEQITLTRESVMKSNPRLYNMFYTTGNKVYCWQNAGAWYQTKLPENPVITLEGKEITCFEFSPDWLQLYVGVYDPSLPDLKGCVYVYDADKIDPATQELTLLKKYEGIADRPIKVFWKNNRK